jgi:hypothetical protein
MDRDKNGPQLLSVEQLLAMEQQQQAQLELELELELGRLELLEMAPRPARCQAQQRP